MSAVVSSASAQGTVTSALLTTSAALAQTQIKDMLWDASQLPAYQQCAVAFQEQGSEIQVNLEQLGWDDY